MTTTPTARKTATKAAAKTATAPAKKAAVAAKKVPARKPAAKKAAPEKATAGKAVARKPTKPAAPAPVAEKPKHKLVRDSFTIPKSEYQLLDALKLRAAALKRPTKKSELLRAGIAALNAMADKPLLEALTKVPSLKTGRPKADGSASKA
ncbi:MULTISPECIES: hypothetical protein [unclassified Rhizobacter]|uniref:hypothetical protein n=1 Tax=unclassified Rhizobacter TaxID=2640088 RepID=UPI000701EB67|nr:MULTISPECIES: hypothetical protein [unclassified Rhizobacter]KQU75986.1 hypothetical protein ASC88_24100 [Rhizobacter sp. Root29]KQW08759.1 hypothetical protein ASC98_24880 [Rhizobacter sp. Root1238]KRB16329.1 hypothetical protein ASE08_25760 [Rhizobacter sp. Root16D2]